MTIVGFIAFVIGWIYAISAFGFFLGVGLGWLPALFIALIVDALAIALLSLLGVALQRRWTRGPNRQKSKTPKASPRMSQDYLDWANREGKWQDSGDQPPSRWQKTIEHSDLGNREDEPPPPPRGSPEYLDWANREGRWADRG